MANSFVKSSLQNWSKKGNFVSVYEFDRNKNLNNGVFLPHARLFSGALAEYCEAGLDG